MVDWNWSGPNFQLQKTAFPAIRNSALHCPFTKLFMFELVTKPDNIAILHCRLFDSWKRSGLNPFLTPFQTYALNWGKYSIRGSNRSYKRAIKEKNYVLFFLHVSLPLVAFSGNTAWGNDFLSKRNIFLEPSLLLLFVSDTKEMAKFDFRGVWFVLCIIKGSYFAVCKYNSR